MSAPSESSWTDRDPRLHLARWRGEGTPLLLLHGMGGNTHWWDACAPFLAESFRPVGLDFHGHGESAWREPADYSIEAFVDNVEAARHALGWSRFFLCGHSLGGRVAVEYASRFPERLLGVIGVDFLPEKTKRDERYLRLRVPRQPSYGGVEPMVERFHLQPAGTTLQSAALRDLARLCVRRLPSGRWTWKYDWRCSTFSYPAVWPVLAKIRVPALVVRGDRSVVIEQPAFERCVSGLAAAPRAEGVVIPGAHHHVPLDAPEPLAAAIAKFAEAFAAR